MNVAQRTRAVLVVFALSLVAALPAIADPIAGHERYYVIFAERGVSHVAAVRAAGGIPVHDFPEYGAVAAWLPPQAIEALRSNPNVTLEVDPQRHLFAQTTPYGIPMVQADLVSDAAAGNCTVCIIDSGYYLAHDDLQDANVTGTNDSGTGNWFEDNCGHGTHVAGTVAALNNTTGVIGVNRSGAVNIHIEKVFNGTDCAWAYSSDLVAALRRCRDSVAGTTRKLVVSMSLGGSFSSTTENRAFEDAHSAGVLSIAAAGNGGNTRTSYPAGYASVVSVAAIDQNKQIASFSQQNSDVELSAPGVAVLSTYPFKGASLTVGADTYIGGHIEGAARTEGESGALVNGGLCGSTNSGWSGKVVLCERGTYSFYDKTMAVQNSGGVAAVIYNNAPGNFSGTLGTGNTSAIPSISLSQEDGQAAVEASTLAASGTVVDSAAAGSGYASLDGTSMATPHVSGVAALIWGAAVGAGKNPTNDDVRGALQSTAEDLGSAGRDNAYGYGLIRAKAAYDALVASSGDGSGGDTGGGTGGDTTAPVISNVGSTSGKGNTFTISWTTDESSDSEVRFTKGASGTYSDTAMVTSHSMSFRGSKGVLYEYYVASKDAAGNRAESGPHRHQN